MTSTEQKKPMLLLSDLVLTEAILENQLENHKTQVKDKIKKVNYNRN